MTLSILIPTYNYNARALVEALHLLIESENIDAEIIVGNDASTTETEWLEEVELLNGVHVMHEDTNQGRAVIRNHMSQVAHGEWLWFIDADAEVQSDFSLLEGLMAGSMGPVVCGGLRHPAVNKNPHTALRYKYERAADRHRSAKERKKHPYQHLATFNLLIQRDLFQTLYFDERCEKYGYEDTLFGIELERHHVPVIHIDNPLIHLGLDTNAEFLAKSEMAMLSLKQIAHLMPADGSRIISIAKRLERWHLKELIKKAYRIFRKPIRQNLLSQHPLLFLFQFYKLGYFLCL